MSKFSLEIAKLTKELLESEALMEAALAFKSSADTILGLVIDEVQGLEKENFDCEKIYSESCFTNILDF